MCKLATMALGAALAAGPAAMWAQTKPETPTTPTTGPNTTGTPDMGANTPQSRKDQRPATRPPTETNTPAPTTPTTMPNTTGTDYTGATTPETRHTPKATTPTSGRQTTGHIPATRPSRATTATTHSGSTPVAADQSDVGTRDAAPANRSMMPNTAAGWLPMLLSGSLLAGAGMRLRALSSKAARR